MGKLIVIEGACDGIGKTTQFNELKKHLENDGYNVCSHHFPSYGSDQGKLAENYLKGEYGNIENLSSYFVSALYAIDRAVTWNIDLKEKAKDNVILLDRYTTSTLIYQSALIDDLEEKKKFIDYMTDFEYDKMGIKKPDNVIFLWTPFEVATNLRNARKENEGIINDIHESNIDFMKKVYDNAMFVADYLNWDKVKCNNGSEMKTIDEIHEEVYTLVKKK